MVNLVVFIFIVTALVYRHQVGHNENIESYLDALYFTVGTLTTDGLRRHHDAGHVRAMDRRSASWCWASRCSCS